MASTAVQAFPSARAWPAPAQNVANDEVKGIWSSMLDSVATGKKLSEKTLIVLGGTPDTQKDFLEALSPRNPTYTGRHPSQPSRKKPPIANRFALGYTYQDLLDTDQDDILARLSVYFMSDRTLSFASLLEPLFSESTIPNSMVVILLDWASPWHWARQLRDWVRILQTALARVDNTCKQSLDDNIKDWKERRKNVSVEGFGVAADGDLTAPIVPGGWDEALGIPLCVVCQNAEYTGVLEREHAWKDDEFDYIQQFLRTILLKYGGSLIYTASAAPGALPDLVRATLGVRAVTKRRALKHNVITRDAILIPPNWDSWGKIRPLGEDFDIEGYGQAWSMEIHSTPQESREKSTSQGQAESLLADDVEAVTDPTSAVGTYETRIEDPHKHQNVALQLGSSQSAGIETPCEDMQSFLAGQMQIVESLKIEDEKEQRAKSSRRPDASSGSTPREPQISSSSRVNEHIGPVQFNVGGIEVDAGDVVKSLKEREAGKPAPRNTTTDPSEEKLDNEKLSSFFAGLVSRGSNSAASSPK